MSTLPGFITVALTGIDLWCKAYVEKHFHKNEEKELCGGKLVLRKRYNKGMMLNTAADRPEMVRTISGVVCGALGIYALYVWIVEECPWKKLGVAFTFAGAISNTYDRYVRKYVVDYFGFKTKWAKLNRITFNLADIFIFFGCGILFVAELVRGKQ